MPPSTFPAPLTMSDNRDVVEGAVVFSLILILSLMYFTVIRVESLRGAQHQKWSKDIEMSPAAAQQPALIKPQEIQPGFLWHQLSPQNPQRTEHPKVLPISDSEISSTAVIVSTHVAYQRTLQSAITRLIRFVRFVAHTCVMSQQKDEYVTILSPPLWSPLSKLWKKASCEWLGSSV